MLIRCEYCGTYFDDCLEKCDNCGGINNSIRRTAENIPQTIEELKEYCEKARIPTKDLHFYIGENYKGAKAFGIYKDENSQKIIVYKNKDNGERNIRYEGTDEIYAVNELYQKLKEILLIARKEKIEEKNKTTKNEPLYPSFYDSVKYSSYSSPKKSNIGMIFGAIISFLGAAFVVSLIFLNIIYSFVSYTEPSEKNLIGKYTIDDKIYYYENGYWFDYQKDDDTWLYNPDFGIDFENDLYDYERCNLYISSALSDYLGPGYYDYNIPNDYNHYESSYSSSSSYNDDSNSFWDWGFSYDWDDDSSSSWDDWDSDWDSSNDFSYDYDYSYDWSSDW